MNKSLVLFVGLLLISFLQGWAQNKQFHSPTAIKVIEIRTELNNLVVKGELDSALFLLKKSEKQIDPLAYLLLFPEERWLIEMLDENFTWVSNQLKGLNQFFVEDLNQMVFPPEDDLFSNLQNLALNFTSKVNRGIKQSDFTQEQKEVLELCFKSLCANEEKNNNIQQELNQEATLFLTNYPLTKYNYYVRHYVRYEYTVSPFGWGVEFFTGYGFFSNQLNTDFSSHVPFGFGFDAFYKRFNLHLSQYIATGKTLQDLNYDNILWEEGSKVSYFIPQLSLGYAIVHKPVFQLMPNAGIGIMNFSPTATEQENNSLLRNHSLSTATYFLGLSLNFDLSKKSMLNTESGIDSNAWFVILRYNYYLPQFSKEYAELTGNMHALTIGISGFARNTKRVL